MGGVVHFDLVIVIWIGNEHEFRAYEELVFTTVGPVVFRELIPNGEEHASVALLSYNHTVVPLGDGVPELDALPHRLEVHGVV